MNFIRLFSSAAYKGTRNYLNSQRIYEILRTIIYFGISLSLFIAGWISTKNRLNLLTVVAILGCLPASKSLISAFMFCRYKSTTKETADTIDAHMGKLTGLYDMVFTGYEKNFQINHITIKGNTICGFSEKKPFEEAAFDKHLTPLLKVDHFNNTNIKIFTDFNKYLERLDQMQLLDCDETNTIGIAETLKSISL